MEIKNTKRVLLSVPEARSFLSAQFRTKRLERGLTQAGLAKRSGVPLSTLRKFEQKGRISLDSLLKILLALNELDKFANALEADEPSRYRTFDDALAGRMREPRKRGYHG